MMSRSIRAEITIQAEPQRVWDILTRFEEYPAWNPFYYSGARCAAHRRAPYTHDETGQAPYDLPPNRAGSIRKSES